MTLNLPLKINVANNSDVSVIDENDSIDGSELQLYDELGYVWVSRQEKIKQNELDEKILVLLNRHKFKIALFLFLLFYFCSANLPVNARELLKTASKEKILDFIPENPINNFNVEKTGKLTSVLKNQRGRVIGHITDFRKRNVLVNNTRSRDNFTNFRHFREIINLFGFIKNRNIEKLIYAETDLLPNVGLKTVKTGIKLINSNVKNLNVQKINLITNKTNFIISTVISAPIAIGSYALAIDNLRIKKLLKIRGGFISPLDFGKYFSIAKDVSSAVKKVLGDEKKIKKPRPYLPTLPFIGLILQLMRTNPEVAILAALIAKWVTDEERDRRSTLEKWTGKRLKKRWEFLGLKNPFGEYAAEKKGFIETHQFELLSFLVLFIFTYFSRKQISAFLSSLGNKDGIRTIVDFIQTSFKTLFDQISKQTEMFVLTQNSHLLREQKKSDALQDDVDKRLKNVEKKYESSQEEIVNLIDEVNTGKLINLGLEYKLVTCEGTVGSYIQQIDLYNTNLSVKKGPKVTSAIEGGNTEVTEKISSTELVPIVLFGSKPTTISTETLTNKPYNEKKKAAKADEVSKAKSKKR